MALWGGFGGKPSFLDTICCPELHWSNYAIRCDVHDGPTGFRTQDMVLDWRGQAEVMVMGGDGTLLGKLRAYRGIVHWN